MGSVYEVRGKSIHIPYAVSTHLQGYCHHNLAVSHYVRQPETYERRPEAEENYIRRSQSETIGDIVEVGLEVDRPRSSQSEIETAAV
jgi:hypothetical protein